MGTFLPFKSFQDCNRVNYSRFRDRSLKRDKSASRSSELEGSPHSAGSRSQDGDQDDDDDGLDLKNKK